MVELAGSRVAFLFALSCIACSTTAQPQDAAGASDTADKSDDPETGGTVDGPIRGARTWYLIDDVFGHDGMHLEADPSLGALNVTISGYDSFAFASSPGLLAVDIGLEALGPGTYEAEVTDAAGITVASFTFHRSYPYLVFVSNDWDVSDNTDSGMAFGQRLHDEHPHVRVTHFVGPYTMTDPALAESRKLVQLEWVAEMRAQYGDEIGLHIHGWCHFVESAGVPCRTDLSYNQSGGDTTGYSAFLSSYTEDEFSQLLEHADSLFVEWGLGKPTSFRAGGWTAEIHTLRALAAQGYLVDASANNWQRLEEWQGRPGDFGGLYGWNRDHWTPISETSQPYFPAIDDILADSPPQLSILEVPDNGILSDYVTTQEMIEIFELNWPNRQANDPSLAEPTVLSVGYHQVNFATYFYRLDGALDHVDAFAVQDDRGPVIYVTAEDLARIFG